MQRITTRITIALTMILSAGAWAGTLPDAVLARAYDDIAPTIGLVEFSMDITNPNTGDRSKRDRNALGLVVSSKGLVMTHGHMIVENADPFNVTVTLGEGTDQKEYEAEVLPKPDDVNVAFVQLKSDTPLNLPYCRFDSAGLSVGESVAIYGILGEPFDYKPALLEKRIGAVLEKPRKTYVLDDAVRFGYVGGPAVDSRGRVVGVIGFDLSRNEGGELYVRSGHPLLYQTALFQKYINNPPQEGAQEEAGDEAWLGVFTQPLTDAFARYWNIDRDGGLIVSTVVPGSPADAAGFKSGDIITSFDGTPIRARQDRDVLDFTKLVRETGAAKNVDVEILRDGQPETINLDLGIRPRSSQDADEYEDETFGLTVRELTTDVRIRLNLPENVEGVIVRSVKSGGVAQLGKMMPGAIIMGFGDHPVRTIEDFKEAVEKVLAEKPDEVAVFARVGPATGFFRLEPRW
jgi:serine protease Do